MLFFPPSKETLTPCGGCEVKTLDETVLFACVMLDTFWDTKGGGALNIMGGIAGGTVWAKDCPWVPLSPAGTEVTVWLFMIVDPVWADCWKDPVDAGIEGGGTLKFGGNVGGGRLLNAAATGLAKGVVSL